MKSSIFIPKTINVGYQNRSGTYTGKLAYVIYYDEKGTLRKEQSWNSWRDKKIPNDEFENVPMSGFVLNKKVGDYSSGWDHRQAYCRVYDPRNFEFEITIENLLYILENANSIKGKGLEGEFVYGWDGKDLILMPVESPDYKEITEYNRIVHNNETIKAKDLIVGATYLTKNNQEMIYMGKFDYYDYDGDTNGKYFWFAYKSYDYEYGENWNKVYKDTYKWAFEQYKSMPSKKFITCLNDKCSQVYSDIYEAMIRTYNFSPKDYDNSKYIPYTFEEFKQYAEKKEDRYGRNDFRRYNNYFFSEGHYEYEISCNDNTNLWTVKQRNPYGSSSIKNDEDFYNRFDFDNDEEKGYRGVSHRKQIIPMTLETLYEKLKPCYKEIYLQNGYLYERKYYYGGEE